MNSVPQIILHQLGGGRFALMTGAKGFTASIDSLSFRLPRCKSGITYARITLDPSDTYSVEFGKIKDSRPAPVSQHSGVYNDQLVPLFERVTGLYTSL